MRGSSHCRLRLRDEHIDVLGIQKPSGEYIGVPGRDDGVEPGDVLVVYATEAHLADLDVRKRGKAGDEAHQRAREECRQASRFPEALAG